MHYALTIVLCCGTQAYKFISVTGNVISVFLYCVQDLHFTSKNFLF